MLSLVERYGYVIVFLGVVLEGVGIPLPGETVLIAAGVLAHQGSLTLWETMVLGSLSRCGRTGRIWCWSLRRAPVCAAVGSVRLCHARAPGTRREVFREARGESGLLGALYNGPAGLWGARCRHESYALGKVRPLQRPGRNRLGRGDGLAWLLSMGQRRLG